MSYCRWQNTVQDLQDCYDNLNETDYLSKDEYRARKRLFKLAQLIVDEFDDVEYSEENEEE